MLPMKSCGIGVIFRDLARSQTHDSGQVFRKFNVEAFRRSNIKMNENKRAFLKPLLWAYGALGAFTAISVVVPIIWERLASRKRQ